MKRKRELEIIGTALASNGIESTEEIISAVAQGLKLIRVEKYADRCKRNGKRKQPDARKCLEDALDAVVERRNREKEEV